MRSTRNRRLTRLRSRRLTFMDLPLSQSEESKQASACCLQRFENLDPHDDYRADDQVGNRERQEELPADLHQLVVPVPRPGPAEPQEAIQKNDDLECEPEKAG